MTEYQRHKTGDDPLVDVVVKLGGSLLRHTRYFDTALAAIRDAARERRVLVVPGGGPFADTVRNVDRQLRLGDDAAHWMAVLGMDQYAHLIVSRLPGSALVAEPSEIAAATGAGHVTILAPAGWLREADPLPHTWDVTSDSIAAWVASAVGAPRLVLVKAPDAAGRHVVDAYFHRALPACVTAVIVPADRVDALRSALRA